MKDFYWDIRPKPEYGTIELRVCDTPLTVEKSAALAAYLQIICNYILEEAKYMPQEDDYLVYNYNRFQACRFGMEGKIVHPQTYESISIREDILSLAFKLEDHAASLGGSEALKLIKQYAMEDNDASYLREQLLQGGSMEYVVNAAIGKFCK